MIKRIIYPLFFIVILIILILLLFSCFKKDKQEINLNYLYECIDDRACITQEQVMLIGENEKELQNGYYDFKIENVERGIKAYINKLWYRKFNENMYEQEYAKKIYEYISKVLSSRANVKLNENEEKWIYDSICESYVRVKNGENINFHRTIYNIEFTFYSENFELILCMEVV